MKYVIRYKLMDEPSRRLTVNNFNAVMCIFELYLTNEWGEDFTLCVNNVQYKFSAISDMYERWKRGK